MDYFKDYLTPAMMFVGKFDATKNDYRIGDICISEDNNIFYLNVGDNKWEEISTTCTYEEIKIEKVEILPKICSRCGAPLKYHICEYCGARY